MSDSHSTLITTAVMSSFWAFPQNMQACLDEMLDDHARFLATMAENHINRTLGTEQALSASASKRSRGPALEDAVGHQQDEVARLKHRRAVVAEGIVGVDPEGNVRAVKG